MTMQRHNRRRNRQAQFTQRILQPEQLETRMLLAGDMVASWQNPVDCNDVNQDGLVTPIDALSVINAMNTRGVGAMPERAAGEPGSTSNVALIDVNGDGILSAVDASLVINALNGEGEGEIAQFRLQVLDTSENPISTIEVGESFLLRVFAQDLRAAEEATGLFAAYTDVEYDASLVTVAANGALQFTTEFPNGTAGDTSVPGLIDEGGAFINAFSGFGTEEKTLFTVEMTATSAGTVTFSSNPADISPNHDTFFFGSNNPIAAADILYDSTTLTIGSATPQIDDLVAFAEQLDSAGVQLWSTRQFSTDAVAQRNLFSDGQEQLPFNEIFDADGNVNAAAQAAGVSQVNTWIFANDSRSEGVVLSVADIATRSGIAIPSKVNPFLAELPDVTITSESPLHVPLNGFDPEGNPLTYTVTSDNPSLLDTTILTGNRSWELDVEGYGTMTFEFYEQRASRATNQFIQLTEDGFYDGIKFHRIIDGFVIQGGDPTATGSGGSDLPNFDDQFNVELQHNRPGILSMAKTTDDTNNSQFFVTEVPTRHLDFNHTIFGQLTEGEQTLFALTDVPTGVRDVPIQDAVITEARVVTDTENGVLLLKTDAASGSGTVTVTATDQFGNETSREFVVNVEPDTINTNPFLDDITDNFSAVAGTTFEFQLGHTDIENDDVSFFASPVSAGATATVDDNGLVSVGIPSNAAPGEVVVVDVTVSQAAADTQRVQILVEGVTPTLTADSFTITEDSTENLLDVLANDGLEDSATIVSVTGADINGVATISADGKTIDYAPTADFFGEATLTYNVQTSSGLVAGVATVTVENVLDPPVARDDFFPEDFPSNSPFIELLVEDSTAQVTLPALNNDLTVDGTLQELTLFDSATDPQFGTLDFSVVALRYTPAPDFFGIDTFTYTTRGVTSDLTSTATVTINVPEINDPPVAADDSVSVASGSLSVIPASDLLSNDSAGPANESDQTLTISSVSTDGTGTVAINADGDIEYTPADGFTGTETIMYAVTDNGTSRGVDAPLTAIASVTVSVTGASPVRNDEFTIPFGSDTVSFDVLANDANPETLDLISVAGAVNGSASVTDGPFRVTYTPDAGFFGTENLTYTVQTSDSETFTGSIVIQVQTAPPTAVDDSFTISGTTLLNVLPNDQLGAGATSLAVDSVASPASGTATVVSAGAGIEYQPNAGFSGEDQFTYTVIDNTGQTSTATITVTVESSVSDNNPPIAINDDLIVDTDAGAQSLDVLANDVTLPDTNETLTITNVTVAVASPPLPSSITYCKLSVPVKLASGV